MKVLIVYASTGAGHFRAAQALYTYLAEQHPEIDAKAIDILEKTNALFSFFYARGYSFLISHAVFLWKGLFYLTDAKGLRLFSRLLISFIHRLNTKKFVRFLLEENPDVIISTHFLASEISAFLKNTKKLKSRLITVITDFAVHPFWISNGTDTYIVASGFTKEQLLLEGIEEKRIKDFGIPIDAKFLKAYDKDSLSKKLGLDIHQFTVLIMTGSFGIGPIEDIVKALHTEVQILAVCAGNKKLYSLLKKNNLKNVKVFGFVDTPQELMAVSDIIITKPGGLSISEALSMELVPIFICAIAGQEEGNVTILKRYGVGLSPKCLEDIKNIVLEFRDYPHKLERIRENIKKIKRPNCLGEISNVICQSGIGDSG